MNALAYVPDLIDRSKVAAALPAVRFVAHPEDLVGCQPDLVVVDLGRGGVLDILGDVRADASGRFRRARRRRHTRGGAFGRVRRDASSGVLQEPRRSPTRPAGEPI